MPDIQENTYFIKTNPIFVSLFIYFERERERERERDTTQVGEGQRERESETPKQALCCQCGARCRAGSMQGLNPHRARS